MTGLFALQHGWGYSARTWDAWKPFLPPHSLFADRSYFHDPSQSIDQAYPICISHSFGLHLIDPSLLCQTKLLVILSGFYQFHSEKSSPLSLSTIEKMLVKCQNRDPQVLQHFYNRCLRPQKASFSLNATPSWELLYEDLKKLHEQTLNLKALRSIEKILILHGEKDAIIPVEQGEELHKSLPNSQFSTIANAGHALHITHAETCWNALLQAAPKSLLSFKMHVAQSFSKSADFYHKHACLQKKLGHELLELLDPESLKDLASDPILEIGCGSGFISQNLPSLFPKHSLHITDLSPGMLETCSKTLKQKKLDISRIQLFVLDGEQIKQRPYALIISGMTFQWFESFAESLRNLFQNLSPKGTLLFSFMEETSFPEWKHVCHSSCLPFTGLSLPKEEEVQKTFEGTCAEIDITTRQYPVFYDSPKSFFQEMKSLGVHAKEQSQASLSKTQWQKLFSQWKELFPNKTKLTYSVCFAKIKRSI